MRKAIKVILWILFSIILLILGAALFLNSQWGQNIVRGRAEKFLAGKLHTEVRIGFLGVGFPKFVVIKDVLVRDRAQDTLLSVRELKVDISMLRLLNKKIDVQQVILTGVHSHIYRASYDTNFNFTYIIDAFAGKGDATTEPQAEEPADTSSSKPFTIDIGRVRLNDIHARFDDHTGGMLLAVDLDKLDLRMKKVDLQQMRFHVKDLAVEGLQTIYIQDTSYLPPDEDKEPGNADLQLAADNISLQKVAFRYRDKLNKMLFAVSLGKLELELNKFGLADNVVDVERLDLSNTGAELVMGKNATPPAVVDTIVTIDTTEGWRVAAGKVRLAGVSFRMDNENELHQPRGMDYAHMYLKGVELDAEKLRYSTDSISGAIKHLAANEQSGVKVKELRTNFTYDPQGAVLNDLYLETPGTVLQDHLEVHYPSLDSIAQQLPLMQLNVDLRRSKVAMSDVLLFVPDLAQQKMFAENADASLQLEARIIGQLRDLDISRLYAKGLTNTEILLRGRLTGLPDADRVGYDLHIATLRSCAKDVNPFVPDSVLMSVRIPDQFSITGKVAGTVQDYNTDLNLSSTDGMAYLKGYLHMSPGKGRERYDMLINTADLNVGRIIRQDSMLGRVTANFVAKGTGLDPKAMSASVDGNIISAMVKGYRYHDMRLYGRMADKQGDLDLMCTDPNVRIQLKGHADLRGEHPAVKADIRIDSIDLQALRLYATELRASGTIHADFPVLDPDYPQGRFIWWQPVVNADGKRYFLDSLYIISRPSADTGQNIIADLGVLTASITGKTPLRKIGPILADHIDRHYKFPKRKKDSTGRAADTALAATPKPSDTATLPADYSLHVVADVVDRPMLRGILPDLKSFDSIHLRCSLTPRTLLLDVTMPDIVYGTTTISQGIVTVRGTDSAFTYRITADQIKQSQFSLYYADINGRIEQNLITTSITLADAESKERFVLEASMQKVGDSQIVHLEPGLKLDYRDWEVAQPNRIVLAGGGFYISNFQISNAGQYIKANSEAPRVNAPMKIDISNFALANLTKAISTGDTLVADGMLTATVNIEQFSPATRISGDVAIRSLVVMGDTLGDLHVTADNKQDNAIAAKVDLKGKGNDIAMNGTYYLKPVNGNDLKFDVDVNTLSLQTFESLAQHQIKNSSGFIKGKLAIQGAIKAPKITGELRTEDLTTTITQLNAEYRLPAEKIVFSEEGIVLNDLDIHDKDNNKATINGKIDTRDLDKIDLDLNVRANQWRVVQSTARDNKLFYGDLLVTANINVKGPMEAPGVDGTLRILKGTEMTIVNPESKPEIESRKGIVRFVNMRDTARRNVLAPRNRPPAQRTSYRSSDVNVNITADKEASFTLKLDQGSGDLLTVKGDANINAAINQAGNITLTGMYSLNDGAYQLNYNLVKRKFRIAKGSTITFAGDPVKNTTLDVTAVYEAQVPPYDLVQREVSDPAQLNYYKQRLPFNVNLYMTGPVMTPYLSFDVRLPEGRALRMAADQVELVQSKLAQVRTDTSELNKQVFAVLVLNRFVSDDPFSSGAGSSASFAAMQSVSTFLGEQLDRAADRFVKGVDLSVDLATTEDYTTGSLRQRTNLGLAASKQLLNDRLKLTLGNNFELEGAQNNNNNQASYIPSNLAADYMLSPDGKYVLRAYRQAYDVGVLQGFVTEAGVNFIVSLDYNNFRRAIRGNRNRNRNDSTVIPRTQKGPADTTGKKDKTPKRKKGTK
ncbi:hypothetical protein GCM10023093_11700 [Nemorincola caseinilytica]|uniref:Translocation and assembly module TamB C-terminal domain-containing protein n=1 Tax=Nemorincola caseinilytica TaxID=2054315 RepID=A0ABP8NBY4_9BACT